MFRVSSLTKKAVKEFVFKASGERSGRSEADGGIHEGDGCRAAM